MGRRRNNPDLVQELIERRWDSTLGEQEFSEKYFSLSSSDMSMVSEAINEMEGEDPPVPFDPDQEEIVVALGMGIETLAEEEFDELYEQLDDAHRWEVDQACRDFTDTAIGDTHWRSDE